MRATIFVQPIQNERMLSDAEAEAYFRAIKTELSYQDGSQVIVRVDDNVIMPVKHFSIIFGQLVREFDADTLNSRLKIEGLHHFQKQTLRVVLETAKVFYSREQEGQS